MNLLQFVSVVAILGLSASVHSNSSFSSLLAAVDDPIGKCYEPGDPGDFPIGADCPDDTFTGCRGNEFCSNCTELKCKCKDGFKEDGENCVGNVRIGGNCTINLPEQCVDFHKGFSRCGLTCQCMLPYHASQNLMRCLPAVDNLEYPCEENTQCQNGRPGEESECRENPEHSNEKQCLCKPGAIDNQDNRCYKIPEFIGGLCSVQVQCEALVGKCSLGKCICREGHVERPDQRICLEKRQRVGENCEDNVQCTGLENASCQWIEASPNNKTVCLCNDGFKPSPDNAVCYKPAECVHDPCVPGANLPDQCGNVNNTICNPDTKQCDCETGFIKSEKNDSCVVVRNTLNSDCTEIVQCNITNSICNAQGKCGCDRERDFVEIPPNDAFCYAVINEVNLPCDHTAQCEEGLGDGSECSSGGKCLCKYRYKDYKNHCYIAASLGGVCHRVEECYVGVNEWTICPNSTEPRRCACRPDAEGYEGKCYLKKRLGDSCETHQECMVYISGGQSHCDTVSKKCACKQGYTEDPTKLLCNSGCGALTYHYASILTCIFILFSTRLYK